MRIDRIRCYHYDKAFTVPFYSLQINRKQADSVIVRMDCDNGFSGYGESAPRRYVTGEDVASVLEVISTVFAPILFSCPVTSYRDAAEIIGMCEAACREKGLDAFHSALGAVDIGLGDLLAQSGQPPSACPSGQTRSDPLPFSVSVPFLPLKLIRDFFPLLSAQLDFRIIKVLIDENLDGNYERLELIRHLAGPGKDLRIEVNGKLTFDQITRQLEHLQCFNIAAMEQPLPPADIANLRRLRQSFDIAIIADEALISIDNARQLIEADACDIFNIKVSKCGGLLKSRAIANLAAANNIACHVGTHVGETEILGSSGRLLARALPNLDAYGGGSDVLFSRLFRKGKPPSQNAIPEPKSRGANAAAYKEDIVHQSRLLGDFSIGPASVIPNEFGRFGDS